MVTALQKQKQLADMLASAQIEDAAYEAKLLIQAVTGYSAAQFLMGAEFPISAENALHTLVQKRLSGIPIQYLLGEWEFFGMEFTVGEGVLIPRQDTEVLVETALSHLTGKTDALLLDLCSGSGCIPLAIGANTPLKQAYAVEFSETAFAYLKENAARYPDIPLHLLLADALSAQTVDAFADNSLDCITSNPPYLNDAEMEELQKEVRFEPENALYAPENGYLFYRLIPKLWKSKLKKGGMLSFEVGHTQAKTVMGFLEENGYKNVGTAKDLSGIDRIVYGYIE